MATYLIKDGKFDFPNIKTGDTFETVQFQVKKSDLSAPDATLSSCRMMFRQGSKTGTVVKSISNGSGMTISDATNWIVTITKFDIDWDVDKYYYDFETTDSNSVIDTPIDGIMEVKQDVTYT